MSFCEEIIKRGKSCKPKQLLYQSIVESCFDMTSWKQDEVLLLQLMLGKLVSVGESMSCVLVTKLISIAKEVINTNGGVCVQFLDIWRTKTRRLPIWSTISNWKKRRMHSCWKKFVGERTIWLTTLNIYKWVYFSNFKKLSKKIHFCSSICLPECVINLFPD